MADGSISDTTLKGSDEDPVRSSPHLWSFLSSPNRTEPVIGLSMITEFRSFSGQNSFVCSCCEVMLPTSKYMCHLIDPRHRFTYMKNKHPKLVELWKDETSLSDKIAELQAKAQIMQDSEGWGQLKVVEKPFAKQTTRNAEISTKAQEPEPSEMVYRDQQSQNSMKQKSAKPLKKKMKQHGGALIGLNFVTCVIYGKRKLFFCELCSVRCHLDHLLSVTHRKAFLERRYPGLTASDVNMESLNEISLSLAAVERSTGIRMKKIKVTAEVFTALRTASISDAQSQLKLQQTKLEAEVDQSGCRTSAKPNSNTALDHIHGTSVEDQLHVSAAATSSLQQEKAPFLETSVIPVYLPPPSPEIPSSSCRPVTPMLSVSSPPPLYEPISSLPLYEPISPPYAADCQTTPCMAPDSSATASSKNSAISLLQPSRNNLTESENQTDVYLPPPCPGIPSSSFQPVTPMLSVSSPPPLYEPISSLPLYEPISPPYAADCQTTPCMAPYSSTTATASSQNSAISLLQPSRNNLTESEDQTDVFPGSILGEESRALVTLPQAYSFPNMPTANMSSNACLFLSLLNLFSREPILGLSNIVECRAMARPTFFLCLNCAEKINLKDFCCHMTSEQHQYICIKNQYPEILQEWQCQTSNKSPIRDLAGRLALMEQGSDAKVIKLDQMQHESLHSADFLSAFEILQRMFGPDYTSPHLAERNQREVSTARLLQDCIETGQDTHRQQQNFVMSLNRTPQHRLHRSQAPERAFDANRNNLDRSTESSSLTRDWLQNAQSPQKTCKLSEKTEAHTQQTQHQFKSQTGLSTNSDSRNTAIHCPESRPETPRTDSTNSLALETQESDSKRFHQVITAQPFPWLIQIKQEKPDCDEVSQGSCSFGVDTAPSSRETTATPFKHTDDLNEYVNNKTARVSDAVVGLSSIIECQSKGQPPLYLCLSCSSKLSHNLIIEHLRKPGHRNSYLKHRYPWLFEGCSDSGTRMQKSVMLMQLAHQVEKTFEDEPGHLQKMEVECAVLQEVKGLSFDKAIKQLQKIRKEQNLCALQILISPKNKTVLVKQENMEEEVTIQHSPCLDSLSETIAQRPKIASKHRAIESDSSHQSPPLCKQIKLSSAVTPTQEMLKHPKPGTCDLQLPSSASLHNPKNGAHRVTVISSRKSLSQNHANAQKSPRHCHADPSHISLSTSEASATTAKDKCSTQKQITSNKRSQKSAGKTKSVAKTKFESLIPGCRKACHRASEPRQKTQTPPDVYSGKLALNEETGSYISTLRQSLDKTVFKNLESIDVLSKTSDELALSPPILRPQQEVHYSGTISDLSTKTPEQNMSQLPQRPLVKNISSENAWNYENRQFDPATLNTNLEAAPSSETDWEIPANDACMSTCAYVDNTAMSYPNLPYNAGHNLYPYLTSLILGNDIPYQNLGYKQPDYALGTGTSCTIAHNYTVASAINAETDVPVTNVRHLTDTTAAYTSQEVYQSQQVYHPPQSLQSPEAHQAYYYSYAYNQALHPNQASMFSGSLTSHGHGYMPTG